MNSEVFATCLSRWAERTPDHPAIITDDKTVGYGELEIRIGRVALALTGAGITAGDRVAVCATNRLELVELLFACSRLRVMLFVINNRLTASEIQIQLLDCRPSLVLAEASFAETIGAAIIGTTAEECFDDLDHFCDAAHRSESDDKRSSEFDGQTIEHEPSLDDGALLVYTSGTTGSPKGAILSQRSLLFTARNGISHEGFDQESVVISVLPMFHVGGLNVQLLPCLVAGGTVVLEPRFDPVRLVNLLMERRPSHLLLVPAVMLALLDEVTRLEVDLGQVMGSLGALNCGSSIVPPELIERFATAGVPVVQVYGATETGPTAIVLDYNDADRFGSCGKPAAHTELLIQDVSGEPADAGQVGELLLRGENLFVGYWENEEATAAAFSEGWYRTGDLGFIDDDGFTYVTGRTKEMIISGGENIYPAEVEQCIERHPLVVAAAVLGRPDKRWGEAPVAFVIVEDKAAVSVEDLRRWTRKNLAGYKQPREWIFVDSFPRTSLGKVMKHHLQPLLTIDPDAGS